MERSDWLVSQNATSNRWLILFPESFCGSNVLIGQRASQLIFHFPLCVRCVVYSTRSLTRPL